MKVAISIIGILLLSSFASASDFPGFFSADIENDAGSFIIGSDRSYTNGIRFNLGNTFSPYMEKYIDYLEKMLNIEKPAQLLRQYLFYVAANMYTPKEIASNRDSIAPVPDDRPYAGWTRLGFTIVGVKPSWVERSSIDTLDISIGALGEGGNGTIQTIWHRWIGVEPFLGWENHVKERIALQLSYTNTMKCYELPWWFDENINFFDIWAQMKLDAGNVFIRSSPSVIFTAGFFRDPDFWFTESSKFSRTTGIELRLFTSLRLNLTAYNGTLDAQTDIVYKVSNLPLTADARGGVSLNMFHEIPFLPSIYLELSYNIEMTDYSHQYYFDGKNFWHHFWKGYVEFYCPGTGPHSPGNDGRQLD